MDKIEVLGIRFDNVTMRGAIERATSFVTSEKPHMIITANPEMVMRAKDDQLLSEIMGRADLVVADGIGVVWASKILKQPVAERIPGIELAEALLRKSAEEGWRVFLLGSAEGVAEQAFETLRKTMPKLNVVGTYHGYFQSGEEEQRVLAQIKAAKPQVLLAALGVPRQEKWLAAHVGELKVPVAIGVGGSFNVWAGVDKRAPLWMRKVHLEWFYRLVRQPWRIKRMAVLPVFVGTIVLARIRQGR